MDSRDAVAAPPSADPRLAQAVDEAVLDLDEVDSTLAGRVIGHDPADFSGFYLRHRVALRRRAARFFGDGRDVDEVVQETFLKVFLALPELETELAASRFAYRVMTNMCIDRYRSETRRPGLLDLDLVIDHLADDLPEDPLIRAEDAAVVREALARLSPEHRAALIKRELEEKPLSVIASEIGIPEHQVKHLLFRARRALRRLLVGSSVDPEVDLTAGEVVDLAGHRLAAAASSTAARGTAIAVVLLIAIGWVLAGSAFPVGGAPRPMASGPRPMALVPPWEGARSPNSHGTAEHRASGHSNAEGIHSKSAASRLGLLGISGDRGPDGGPSASGGEDPTPPPSASPTPTAPTPPPASSPPGAPPRTAKFAVQGLLNSQQAEMQDQSRVVRGAGQYESSANFVAATPTGMFEMAQVLDFTTTAGGVTQVAATLNPVVPIGNLGAGYVTTGQPDVTIQPTDTGYDVTVAGTAAALSGLVSNGALLVTLHATYDKTLTEVTTEQVTLSAVDTEALPTPLASPTSSPAGNNLVVSSG